MKKILVWLLCVAMVLSMAACGQTEEETAAAETDTAAAETDTAAAESDAAAEADAAAAQAEAMAAYEAAMKAYEEALATLGSKLGAYDADAVVMTINGQEITWDVYFCMICTSVSAYVNQMGVLPSDFTVQVTEDMTLDEAFKGSADEYLRYCAATAFEAAERGITIDSETQTELDSAWEDICEQEGGEEALVEKLNLQGITKNSFFYYTNIDALCEPLATAIYGSSEDITDEQAEEWAAKNNQVRAKHILLMTQDGSEEEKAEIRSEMEAILAELQALVGDNAALEARFDEIMNEKSEDTGLAAYPEGYVFGTGEMVPEFETAAFALEPYGLSEIVETSYGFHILLKLPMEASVNVEFDGQNYTTLADKVRASLFAEDRAKWAEEAEVVFTDAFADFTVGSLFA